MIASALVPLVGVLAGGWSLREVVVLYWAENVVIGAMQAIRMLTVAPPEPVPLAGRLFITIFFTFHYGLFCFVHGVFVFVLTSEGFPRGGPGPSELFGAIAQFPRPFWLALALIAASHLWNLVTRFFLGGERTSALPAQMMAAPYKHIIVLHVGILFGAFISITLGNPIAILVIIVIGKLLIDLRALRRESGPDERARTTEGGR